MNQKAFLMTGREDPANVSGGLGGSKSACNAGDPGLIPGSRRSPGEGHGKPF